MVGMMAGVPRGAPVFTADLDLVHRRSAENVSRLLRVLGELDASYRHNPRRLRPAESHLMSAGHQLLSTTHGDLDCLGSVGEGQIYENLLARAPELDLGEGLSVDVIDLPTLTIQVTRNGGVYAEASGDGRFLYYLEGWRRAPDRRGDPGC